MVASCVSVYDGRLFDDPESFEELFETLWSRSGLAEEKATTRLCIDCMNSPAQTRVGRCEVCEHKHARRK